MGKLLVAAAFAVMPQLVSSTASAGIEACNNIDISGNAKCEVVVEGGCVARCEPVSFQATCSAELYAKCDGQCTANASVDCQATCSADCSAKCTVDPGSFECRGGCEANCGGKCDGYCAASANAGECRAQCKATCSGECDASCSGTKPEASCDAKCEASCSGSCDAQANLDCQVNCQASGFAKCETDLQGGCEAQCTSPDGALFCDGQFIDASELRGCLDYLEGVLKIDVEGYAYADGECSGNTCEGEAGAGVSCSASPAGASKSGLGALAGVIAGLGLLVARRRRA
jgi:hypothetical protein